MAHWGIAKTFDRWGSTRRSTSNEAWEEIKVAKFLHATPAREREYIAAVGALRSEPGVAGREIINRLEPYRVESLFHDPTQKALAKRSSQYNRDVAILTGLFPRSDDPKSLPGLRCSVLTRRHLEMDADALVLLLGMKGEDGYRGRRDGGGRSCRRTQFRGIYVAFLVGSGFSSALSYEGIANGHRRQCLRGLSDFFCYRNAYHTRLPNQ